jgi:hypothetical protein
LFVEGFTGETTESPTRRTRKQQAPTRLPTGNLVNDLQNMTGDDDDSGEFANLEVDFSNVGSSKEISPEIEEAAARERSSNSPSPVGSNLHGADVPNGQCKIEVPLAFDAVDFR